MQVCQDGYAVIMYICLVLCIISIGGYIIFLIYVLSHTILLNITLCEGIY